MTCLALPQPCVPPAPSQGSGGAGAAQCPCVGSGHCCGMGTVPWEGAVGHTGCQPRVSPCSPRSPGSASALLGAASPSPARPCSPGCATARALPHRAATCPAGAAHLDPLPPCHRRPHAGARPLLLEKFILPLYGEILFVVNSSVMNLEFL